MTLNQFKRSQVAFREEVRAERLDRFHAIEKRRAANASGFARRAAEAKAAREAAAK